MNEKTTAKDILLSIMMILAILIPLALGLAGAIVEFYFIVQLIKLLWPVLLLLILGVSIFVVICASCQKD